MAPTRAMPDTKTTGPTPEAARRCPACDGCDLVPVRTVTDLRRCTGCGHVVQTPAGGPNNEVFESDEYVEWRASSPEHRRIAERRIDALDAAGLVPGDALEIGCATGEAVEALAARGWRAYGLDLSDAAVAAGVSRIRRNDTERAHLAVGTDAGAAGFPTHYDLVCAFHVVEHVQDLDALGASLADLVRPGGHLHLRVPNWESLSRRVTGRHWPDLMPEHVHHFGPTSMGTWLRRRGFEPVDVRTEGRAREWLGGARRALGRSGGQSASTSELAASPRRLRTVQRAETLGAPWFWVESRLGAGSELVVLARRLS